MATQKSIRFQNDYVKPSKAQVLELIEESKWVPEYKTYGQYSGIRCARNKPLNRFLPYTTEEERPSYEYLSKYLIASGGLIDSQGHYGPTLQNIKSFEDQGYTPTECHWHFNIGVYKEHLRIKGVKPSTWPLYLSGLDRKNQLEKAGVQHQGDMFSLGSMKDHNFWRLVMKAPLKITAQHGHLEINGCIHISQSDNGGLFCNEGLDALRAVPARLRSKIYNDLAKYQKRNSKRPYQHGLLQGKIKTNLLLWDKVLLKFGYEKPKLPLPHMDMWGEASCAPWHSGVYQYTSEGMVHTSLSGNLLFNKGRAYRIKSVNGYSVAKIGNTVFLWSNSFHDHIESRSLRDAIQKMEKRVKHNGLCLTLNMVRNDRAGTAGFCLNGTKNFARERMPFLYHLIKGYGSWSDVPTDIMEAEFILADKSIFRGFPSPIK